jgi:triosephosphate isomerase
MPHRRPFVGGNWKMNTDLASGVELADDLVGLEGGLHEQCDIAIFPPFPYLKSVGKTLVHSGIKLGAQDVYHQPNGAFTGEVSTEMLLDLNVGVVLIGHSERRHVMMEDDDLVNAKARASIEAGLDIILCVGETFIQREAGRTEAINLAQLEAGLREIGPQHMRQVTIAYEPVWAIGTGQTSTPEDAEAVHGVLRQKLGEMYDESTANSVRIQYGGSVNANNAGDLFAQPDIDGGLIGGASLKAEAFLAIVKAATQVG